MMLYKRFQRIIELIRHLEALAKRHPEGFSPKDLIKRFFAPLRMTNGMQNCQHAYVRSTLRALAGRHPEGFSPKDLTKNVMRFFATLRMTGVLLRMTGGDFAQNYIINV